jgi:hypothetical protein
VLSKPSVAWLGKHLLKSFEGWVCGGRKTFPKVSFPAQAIFYEQINFID